MDLFANASDEYRTEPKSPALLARMLPSLVFYVRFLRTVFRASSQARRAVADDHGWLASSLSVLGALEDVGVRITITGLNFVRSIQGPCVFVANHMSTLETVVLPGIVQPLKDVTFVVKRGIIEYPVFRDIMRTRDPIVVDRRNPRADLLHVLEDGTAKLRSGRSIVVFPQTTRSLEFDPDIFNTIGVKLARNANVPLVPIAVRSDAWGIGRPVKEFGRINPGLPVHIAFGAPLIVQGRGVAEHAATIDFIREHLAAWGVHVKR